MGGDGPVKRLSESQISFKKFSFMYYCQKVHSSSSLKV